VERNRNRKGLHQALNHEGVDEKTVMSTCGVPPTPLHTNIARRVCSVPNC
jgi:hypothetical protein